MDAYITHCFICRYGNKRELIALHLICQLERLAELFANNEDSNQMPLNAASDLSLHCLPITL